jgi:hypothetical protein
MYFTWRPEGSQADIWFRDLRTGNERPVTCSSEEEYIGKPTPGRDGLTVVRIEPDLTRKLVVLGLDGKPRRTLFPSLTQIGAYHWADAHTVALMVGNPDGSFALLLGDVSTGALDTVAQHIRGLLGPIPGTRAISYLDDTDPEHLDLKSLDLGTHATAHVLALPDGVDQATWLADGSMLAGHGTQILRASPASPAWREVATLAGKIDGAIARLTISDDQRWLAVVTR